MESIYPSESNIIAVREVTEHSNQEDIENRNEENLSSNKECVEDQLDNKLRNSENNIPISNIIVVREATEHSNQEDIENKNEENVSSNKQCFQDQVDN